MEGKSGKILVESAEQARRNELLEEFWDTYYTVDPNDNAVGRELEEMLEPEDWAAAHEIFEEEGPEAARAYFDTWPRKQSEEYYPGPFGAELSEPPDPKRIKARGGRVKYAGGGSVRKALQKLNNARSMLEDSDPDFDEISRMLRKDDDLKQLGRRLGRVNIETSDPTLPGDFVDRKWSNLSRMMDEEQNRLITQAVRAGDEVSDAELAQYFLTDKRRARHLRELLEEHPEVSGDLSEMPPNFRRNLLNYVQFQPELLKQGAGDDLDKLRTILTPKKD